MKKIFFLISFFILANLSIPASLAQNDRGIALSITPPLIKNNVSPGQIWKSYIKLVNNNKHKINVYIELMDFKGGAENGTVEFIDELPESEEDKRYFLSRWIVIDPGPIEIEPQKSKEIPFIIDVPEDAGIGGHYAAILAGTRPPEDKTKGTNIKISSLLGSLIFLNVKNGSGEISESGQIREFSAPKTVFQAPKVDFTVRFENTGNVHIQPQGEIRIYDWLGKDKGHMTLNHNSEFGNVLPDSIRKWNFSWQNEDSLMSMGRYRAVLIVGYGEESGRQTDTREMYFWVLNYKKLGIILGSVIFIFAVLITVIKLYIKRTIRKTQEQFERISEEFDKARKNVPSAPLKKKVVDLKNKAGGGKERIEKNPVRRRTRRRSFWGMFVRLLVFILFILIIIGTVILYLEFNDFGTDPLKKEAPAEENGQNLIPEKESGDNFDEDNKTDPEEREAKSQADEEEIGKEGASDKEEEAQAEPVINKKDIKLAVLNGSGQSGVAGKAGGSLEEKEYFVAKLGNAQNFNYDKTEIKYKDEYSEFAEEIKGVLGVDAEMEKNEFLEEDILIILGKDYQ